jgi:glycosyltransferase involved in cell wall biosynthesis
MKLSFVLPVLGYEPGLEKTLSDIPINKLSKRFSLEILIIWTPTKDHNNTEQITNIAKKFNAKVVTEKNKGFGKAHKTGYKIAHGDIIVASDSDGTYPLELTDKFLEIFLRKKLDFLSVNRFDNLEKNSMTISHFIGNKILTFLVNILFGLRIKDSQSGMWILRKSILKYLNLKENSATFATEIKIKSFKKVRSEEVNGRYKKRIGKNKMNSLKLGISQLIYIFKYFLSRL